MSRRFSIIAQNNPCTFPVNLFKGDVEKFYFDFNAWQEDNETIVDVIWTVEGGSCAISAQNFSDGIASALIAFNDSGCGLISVIAETASEKKKAFLEVNARDRQLTFDDYGFST